MIDFSGYEPKQLFDYFQELSRVPRCSGYNQEISDYLKAFAERLGLPYYQDEKGNIIIYKEATKGYEMSEPVMIQGHLDMVAAKTDDSTHDFTKDPIEMKIEDGWITADGTTLGADNGIAIAMAMLLLESEDIPHPALEVVMTVDEEIGMLGADFLDASKMQARKILNIDSEEEGVITVGCAGAVDCNVSFPVIRETISGVRYEYVVDGLLGGHSGNDIHLERCNAANLTGRLLCEAAEQCDFRIVSLQGGSVTNAIMNKIVGEIVVDPACAKEFEKKMAESYAVVKKEFAVSDPDLHLTLTRIGEGEVSAVSADDEKKIITYLHTVPQGAQNYSQEIKGLTQTSLNMGVVRLDETEFITRSMIRSSVNSQKRDVCRKVKELVEVFGGSATFTGNYDAWEINSDSKLLEVALEAYETRFAAKAEVSAVHGGIECGKWAEKFGSIDAISIGPDMFGVHSVHEKVNIASVERSWVYVKAILAACK